MYNTSEQVIGKALRGMRPEEREGLIFQTKAPPPPRPATPGDLPLPLPRGLPF